MDYCMERFKMYKFLLEGLETSPKEIDDITQSILKKESENNDTIRLRICDY